MGKKLRIKLYAFLAVLLLILAGGSYCYVHFYMKTPDYALQQIQASLEDHDTEKFQRYVDLEDLLDTSYDDFMSGILEVEQPLSPEVKATVGDLTQMLKAPLLTSFKAAVLDYVRTGDWNADAAEGDDRGIQAMDSAQVLEKSGLRESAFRKVDSLARDKEAGTAVAKVRIFQAEANEEFVLDVQFTEQADGSWRVTEITNFHEFIVFVAKSRQEQLSQYADTTAEIIARHDASMMQAQEKMSSLLSRGSLGNKDTREALKAFMEDTIRKDWQQRKDELEAVPVPAAAQTLHKLRLKICDLHIAYATGYSAWMTDKKAATIREADRQLKQAKTLEQEEKFLTRRVSGKPALVKEEVAK